MDDDDDDDDDKRGQHAAAHNVEVRRGNCLQTSCSSRRRVCVCHRGKNQISVQSVLLDTSASVLSVKEASSVKHETCLVLFVSDSRQALVQRGDVVDDAQLPLPTVVLVLVGLSGTSVQLEKAPGGGPVLL